MDREALETLLNASLPVTHGPVRLELSESGPDVAPDGCITVGLGLHNDATGESGEQTVQLVPAGQDPARVHAYVQAWARSLPSLLACVLDRMGERSVAPSMLEFPQLALERSQARTEAQFVEQLTDPGTVGTWAAAADAANAAEWVRDVCQDLGLGKHTPALAALCRTGIDLTPGAEGGATGHSSLGGAPDLPPGAIWPHRREHAMSLLAQIDLAEMSRCDDDQLLPPAGLLQIYADLTSGTAWDEDEHGPGLLVTIQPPDTHGLVSTAPPAGAQVLARRAVVPSVDLSLPPLDSPFYRDLTDLDLTGSDPTDPSAEFAAFVEFLDEFHPPLADDDRPRHRLLGYADPLQNDPWAQCSAAEPDVPPTHWQLLAQIDSEPDALLGDGGMVYVFVPRDALAAGDFTRARGVWEMH